MRSSGQWPRLHGTVRLSADGVAKVLGDLEALVIRTVWKLDRPASARQLHEAISKRHDVRTLTVITVLNRLVTKGLLDRAKQDGVFHYTARLSEEEFLMEASRWVMEGVLPFGPGTVVTSFVDVLAEQDPECLAELGRLVRRRLAERGTP